MGIGLSGMISGLDTDSIVKAMVSAQQTKATKIENKITLNKWTTEAWSGLNTKIYSFYTKFASKLRMQSSYMTRTAKSSNESIVTAKAVSSAAVGTHSLQIKQLASSQYVTGKQLKVTENNVEKKANYSKSTKLTEMGTGVKAGTIITITGKKSTENEAVTKLEVTDKTTVNDFLEACKKSGLTASFDTTQQRFFISSSQSGKEDAFSITTSQLSSDAADIFHKMDEMVDTTILSSTEKTNYENAMATLRQNIGLIGNVLSTTYDESDKTQKAVYDAIETIKNISVNQYADETAKSAEAATLNGLISAAASAAATETDGTKATFEAYGKTYTYTDFKNTVEGNMEKDLVAKADKAGMEAIKELKLESLGEGYVDPTTITKEKVKAAEKKITDSGEKTAAYEAKQAEYDAAVADGTMAEDELETLKNETETLKSEADALAKEAAEAKKVVDTWNYQLKDADGNPMTDANGVAVTVASTHLAAYDTAYGDGITEAELAEGIKDAVIAENKEAYNKNISDAKADILADTTNTDITDLKAAVETNLKNAAAYGTATSADGLLALGLSEIDDTSVSAGGANGMAVVAAANAVFVLDGAEMEETSNNFTVNGITLDISATTLNKDTGDYDTVQITVGKDGDSTYNLIKEALTEYNSLIEEMNKLYRADSARGYDPLTDEQKEAMTEEDIKNWEDKIKGSLLRRDNTLGSLLSGMRTALSSTYTDEETGKTYSLSTYGIVTGNYTENGKLHIYGNEDDATYATYTDRLKAALEEDPDQVMEVLTNVFGQLYETMTEKCAKTEVSSALTFYNDKQYNKLLKGYEKDLDTMEDRIKDLEDKYYKQFTAMETAMSKLQSQQNSLASLLGQTMQQ